MQNLRRASQGIFLILFLFLFIQTESKGADELGYSVKLFLDFDPLIFITTLLSSHYVQKALYLSLIVVVITVILGRVFCGWVCPLGTLNNIFSFMKKQNRHSANINWNKAKYYILIFLIVSSIFTLQLTGLMDPMSLIIRSFTISIYPVFNYIVRAFFDTIYDLKPESIVEISESIYSFLKESVLSFRQPYFNQNLFIGLLFLIVLGLNFVERRFWCRYLCPLGALLGVLSRYSILKRTVSEGCNECGVCASVCQGNAYPDKRDNWRITECIYCWNCDDICPQNAIKFKTHSASNNSSPGLDLGRRRVIISALTGIVVVPLIRTGPFSKSNTLSPGLIRPPGALEEKEFLRRCIKCGECMKVCITNGLQPTLLEAGFEGIWSPVLIPRIGYCEYRCTLCGQVCPTGAIMRLPLEEKVKVKLGLAIIDRGRCLPYAHSIPCIVCEEVCPTPKKAIWFEKVKVKDRKGREKIIQQPKVDLELCIGCGICEAKCPIKSKPAIYVINTGETKAGKNQMLNLI
jgi:polyferredoxin